MTRLEAIYAMLFDDAKITYNGSDPNTYMYFDKYTERFIYKDGIEVVTGLDDLANYEVYEEPNLTCDGKIVKIDGKKYKLSEVK